jgi:hypothetical protein
MACYRDTFTFYELDYLYIYISVYFSMQEFDYFSYALSAVKAIVSRNKPIS